MTKENETEAFTRKMNRAEIEKYHQRGLISTAARQRGLDRLNEPLRWWQWAHTVLRLSGVLLLIAGIIYFFAYNWEYLKPWTKLTLVELILVGTFIGAMVKSIDRLSGQIYLFAASFFVGVFLAVYGQIYQTGADSYELFLGWSILISAWVIISNFSPTWFLFILIVNAGVYFYWWQVGAGTDRYDIVEFHILMASVNLVFLILRETAYLFSRFVPDLWLRWILSLAVLYFSTVSIMFIIFDFGIYNQESYEASAVSLYIFIIGGAATYVFIKSRDLFLLSMTGLSIVSLLLAVIGKELFSSGGGLLELKFLFFSFVVIAAFGALAWALIAAKKYLDREADLPGP